MKSLEKISLKRHPMRMSWLIFLVTFSACGGGGSGGGSSSGSMGASLAPSPSQLSIEGAPQITAGQCSGPYIIKTLDSNNNPASVSQEIAMRFSKEIFLSQSDCSAGINISSNVTLATGQNSTMVYFKSTLAQAVELKASATGFMDGMISISIQPDQVSKFYFVGDSFLEAGVCKSYTLIAQDQYGNKSSVSEEMVATLKMDSIKHGKFYRNDDCSSENRALFFSRDQEEQSFYFKNTAAEVSTFDAHIDIAGFTTEPFLVTIGAAAPSKLDLSEGADKITAGDCSPYIMRTQDRYGNLSRVSQDVSINLLSGSSNVKFYSEGSCSSNVLSTIVIPSNQDTLTVYVHDIKVETPDLKISDTTGNLTTVIRSIAIVAAQPQNLSLTGATAFTAGGCGEHILHIKDANGNSTSFSQNIAVTLSGGQALFYSDSSCQTLLQNNSLSVLSGESQKTFYLKDIKAETFILQGAYDPFSPATLNVTVAPDVAASLVFTAGITNTSYALGAGNCLSYTVALKDQHENSTTFSIPQTLTLSVNPQDGASFSSVSGCGSAENTITIPQGQAMTSFFFKPMKAGVLAVTARMGNIPAQSFSVAVNPGPPRTLAVTGDKTTFFINQCVKFSATFKDDFLNSTSYYPPTSIGLQSLMGNGAFYNDVGCTSSNPINITSPGPSSIDFYFKSTLPQSTTLQVSTGTNVGLIGTLPVSIQNPVYVITAGGAHTCAIKEGAAKCWGSSAYGQLGNGTQGQGSYSSIPVQVFGLESGVTAISAGQYHTCAIKDGSAWCWGENSSGKLGDGTAVARSTPVQVYGLTSGVTAISVGGSHVCAIQNNAVKCWGNNYYGQLGNFGNYSLIPISVNSLGSGVSAISAGSNHSCVIQNSTGIATAKCFGKNTNVQLGYFTPNPNFNQTPTAIDVSGLSKDVFPIQTIQTISAGGQHTCATTISGAARCWAGTNNNGELLVPYGSDPSNAYPPGSGVLAISAGSIHTCLIVNGAARCRGYNFYGQLGDESLISGVQAISAGDSHTCAIQNGVAKCWGFNSVGQLGNNSTIDSTVPVPVSGF